MPSQKNELWTYVIEHRSVQGNLIKQYVGVTSRPLKVRLAAHLREASRAARSISPHSLGYAIRQELRAGEGAAARFSIRGLQTHQSQADMLADEARWIAELKTMAPNGYNLMPGGSSAGGVGNRAAVDLYVDGQLRHFESIAQAAHALAEAASIDPARFASRVYWRLDRNWPLAEAFELEPHQDRRKTELSLEASASGVPLDTLRSRRQRERQILNGVRLPRVCRVPHPFEHDRLVSLAEFAAAAGEAKQTVTARLRAIYPTDHMTAAEIAFALKTPKERRRILEVIVDGEVVREGQNELAARFQGPGNSAAAIRKRLGALGDGATNDELLQALGRLPRKKKRLLVRAEPVKVRKILLEDWSLSYRSQLVQLPRQMDFVRWLLERRKTASSSEHDKRAAALKLQRPISAFAKTGLRPWEIANEFGIDEVGPVTTPTT